MDRDTLLAHKKRMQTNVLTKVLDELGKESPKLDYIRGMLETLVEMQSDVPKNAGIAVVEIPLVAELKKAEQKELDEAALLDAQARIAMTKMPPLQTE